MKPALCNIELNVFGNTRTKMKAITMIASLNMPIEFLMFSIVIFICLISLNVKLSDAANKFAASAPPKFSASTQALGSAIFAVEK